MDFCPGSLTEALKQAGSHSGVFAEGEMLQFCNRMFTEMLQTYKIKWLWSELNYRVDGGKVDFASEVL